MGLLPPLTRRADRVSFAPSHARVQQLADLVRLNLLLADWNDPEHQESLLHRHRAQYAPESCTSTCERRVASRARSRRARGNTTCARHSRSSRRPRASHPRRVGLYPQNGRGRRPRRARRRRGRRRFARERRVLRVRRERNKRYDEYQRRRRFVFRERRFANAAKERARRTEGERGRRAGAHLRRVVSDASPPWLPETHPLSRVETALERAARARRAATCHLWFSRRRADAAWCVLRAPSRARRGARRAGRPTTCSPRTIPIARFITIVRNGPCRTNSSSGNPARVGADAMGHRGGHWSSDWRSTESSKVSWLIGRLRDAGAAPAKRRRRRRLERREGVHRRGLRMESRRRRRRRNRIRDRDESVER